MEPKRLLIAIPIFGVLLGAVYFVRPVLRSIDEHVALVGLGSGFAAMLFALWLINFIAVSESEYADIPGKRPGKDRTVLFALAFFLTASLLYFRDDWTSQYSAGFLMAFSISFLAVFYLDRLSNRNERTR